MDLQDNLNVDDRTDSSDVETDSIDPDMPGLISFSDDFTFYLDTLYWFEFNTEP